MCACFGVSCSGYYAWFSVNLRRSAQRQHLDKRVKALFDKHKCRYGAKRLQQQILLDDQQYYNLKTVAASLQRQSLVAKAARKFKAITHSKHTLLVFDNLLNQNFITTTPNHKWVGDITYLWTEQGWLYLAVIHDLYSRQVVGWLMSERITTDLANGCFQTQTTKRCNRPFRPRKPILFPYLPAVAGKAPTDGQYERKGNCYDNACPAPRAFSIR